MAEGNAVEGNAAEEQDARMGLPSTPAPGTKIGHFIVRREIGEGGMGIVFEARDEHLQRDVAIKLLRTADHLGDTHRGEDQQRLLREAQAMAMIIHPNLVTIFEVGKYGDDVFLAMEYVTGPTLRKWLDGTHPLETVVDVFCQAGEGLQAIHETGLVHRDFKPSNVIVDLHGHAKVLDLGIARRADTSSETTGDADPSSAWSKRQKLQPVPKDVPAGEDGAASNMLDVSFTRRGDIVGTPGYIAPEQLEGRDVGPRADQFSFAVALFEALAGEHPFQGDTDMALIANMMMGEPKAWPPDSAVPVALREAVSRGMEREPSARFPTMSAMVAACRNALGLRGQLALFAKRWDSSSRDENHLLRSAGFLTEAQALLAQGAAEGIERAYLQVSLTRATQRRTRRRIFYAALASLVVGLVATGWFLFERSRQLEAAVEAQVQGSIRGVQENLRSTFEAHEETVELLSAQRGAWLPHFEALEEANALAEPRRTKAVETAVTKLNQLFFPVIHRNAAVSSLMVATRDVEYLAFEDPDAHELDPPYRDYNRVVDRKHFGDTAFELFASSDDKPLRSNWLDAGERDVRGQPWNGYQPEARPWFKVGVDAGLHTPAWTKAYLFFVTKDPGVTASLGWKHNAMPMVLGVDFMLTDISLITASFQDSDLWVMVTTAEGSVVGLPPAKRFSNREAIRSFYADFDAARRRELKRKRIADSGAQLPGVVDLDIPDLLAAYEAGQGHSDAFYTFEYGGETLHAGRAKVDINVDGVMVYVAERVHTD